MMAQELGGSFALGPWRVLLGLAPNILLIPGTRTRVHLAENLAAADVSLDDAALTQLTRNFPAPRRARDGGAGGST
jgi:pyridoxine 4-dehydrogenase